MRKQARALAAAPRRFSSWPIAPSKMVHWLAAIFRSQSNDKHEAAEVEVGGGACAWCVPSYLRNGTSDLFH